MKRRNLTILLFASIITLTTACNKGKEQCETWEFQDQCVPKTASTTSCYEYVRRVSLICNAELEDAHEGRVSIIKEDSARRIERHYIKPAK